MSTVLAVHLQKEEATFITARAVEGEPFTLLSFRRLPRTSLPIEASPAGSDAGESPALIPTFSPTDFEIDDTIGLLETERVLYGVTELPFRDPRKVEQVAPLQMQDNLPFDLEDFLVDSIIGSTTKDDNFRILSSVVPKELIAEALAFCTSIGAEPRMITTGAAALSALGRMCHPDEKNLIAYVEFSKHRVSLAILQAGKPIHFRDFQVSFGGPAPEGDSSKAAILSEICRNIGCSIAKVEEDATDKVMTTYVVGLPEQRDLLARHVSSEVLTLRLEELIVNEAPEDIELADICWSLGLFASKFLPTKKADRQLIDFRRGPFAFHRLWQDVWSALQGELFYITLAVVLALIWWGQKVYTSVSALSEVEARIEQVVSQALPGESVPKRAELSFLQSRLDQIESELSGLGSLSALSPLEALKELTATVGSSIDLNIDSLSVGVKQVRLRGSVAENPQVGTLSQLLKERKDRFCDVQVDNKGKSANSRVGVTAEITLCD